VEVEEEEPEECRECCEEAEAGIRVPGGGFLHLVGENGRHGAPSHWTPNPIPMELRRLIETLRRIRNVNVDEIRGLRNEDSTMGVAD